MMQQAVPVHEVPPSWFVWVTSGLLVYGTLAVLSLVAVYFVQLHHKKNDNE